MLWNQALAIVYCNIMRWLNEMHHGKFWMQVSPHNPSAPKKGRSCGRTVSQAPSWEPHLATWKDGWKLFSYFYPTPTPIYPTILLTSKWQASVHICPMKDESIYEYTKMETYMVRWWMTDEMRWDEDDINVMNEKQFYNFWRMIKIFLLYNIY